MRREDRQRANGGGTVRKTVQWESTGLVGGSTWENCRVESDESDKKHTTIGKACVRVWGFIRGGTGEGRGGT